MKLTKLVDLQAQSFFKIMLYGQPGVGKTVLALQAPKPIMLFDFDPGAAYAMNAHTADGEGIIDGLDTTIARDAEPDEFLEFTDRLVDSAPPFKTVIIDTLSELQVLQRATLLGPRLTSTKADWGVNSEWVRRVMRNLQVAHCHVIYVCHEDHDDGRTEPALTPALLNTAIGLLDAIIWMTSSTQQNEKGVITAVRRRLWTAPLDDVLAKDRTSLLPVQIINPTGHTLYDALLKKSTKASHTTKGKVTHA
jgi:hypothetical protein